MERLPEWFRSSLQTTRAARTVGSVVAHQRLGTICASARCPNRTECWSRGTATFLILGDRCTRHCGFCAVLKGPEPGVDEEEPERVAEAVCALGLAHVVITSVTRDDLPDGGAEQFARTLYAIRKRAPRTTVELLVPDFRGQRECLEAVLKAKPDVLGHNLETVRRLHAWVRPEGSYEWSLNVLRWAAEWGSVVTKSALMLGLGESDEDLVNTLADLRGVGCQLLVLGQYLAPTRSHIRVARFVAPEIFDSWAKKAKAMGFAGVVAGPKVRSSYCAAELLATVRAKENACRGS